MDTNDTLHTLNQLMPGACRSIRHRGRTLIVIGADADEALKHVAKHHGEAFELGSRLALDYAEEFVEAGKSVADARKMLSLTDAELVEMDARAGDVPEPELSDAEVLKILEAHDARTALARRRA